MITAYGNLMEGYGVSVAFEQHVTALGLFVPTEVKDLNNPEETSDEVLYVHGLPGQFRYLEKRLGEAALDRKRVIAYWVCESTKLNEAFHHYAKYVDEIWTASEFCAEVFEEELGKTVKVVPHGVTSLQYGEVHEEFTFYFEFDGASRILRKNPFDLLTVFKKAFPKSEGVKLLVKVKNFGKYLTEEFKRQAKGYNVEMFEGFQRGDERQDFWSTVDCFVSLHKAEGFGLSILEAMSMGVPVVTTGWSGNVDFTPKQAMVDYTIGPCDDRFYPGEWAFPDLDDAAITLQLVREKKEFRETLRRDCFAKACQFSPSNTISKTLSAIT